MNKKQLVVMWIGIIVAVIIILNPPYWGNVWNRMYALLIMVALIAGGAIVTLKDHPKGGATGSQDEGSREEEDTWTPPGD